MTKIELKQHTDCGIVIPEYFDLAVIYNDGSESIAVSVFFNFNKKWAIKYRNESAFECTSKKEAFEYIKSEMRHLKDKYNENN